MTRRLTPAERLAAMERDVTLKTLVKAKSWDQHVVEQAVFLYGMDHDQWTCNDLRDLLPELGHGYLGVAINSLKRAGVIARVPVEGVPSTSERTHGHRLAVWMLTAKGHRIAAQRFHRTEDAA